MSGPLMVTQPASVGAVDTRVGARLRRHLTEYWKLDEAAGVRYSMTGRCDLTDNNSVLGTGGPSLYVPRAAQFTSGNSEYLSRVSNSTLQMGDIDFTFVVWVLLDDEPADRNFFSKYVTGTNSREYRLYYVQASDQFAFGVTSDGTGGTLTQVGSLENPTTATWYMVACGHDSVANTIFISVNAGPFNTAAHAGGVLASEATFMVGAFNTPTAFHNGRIAGLGMWKNLVLTRYELGWLYRQGLGRVWPWRQG